MGLVVEKVGGKNNRLFDRQPTVKYKEWEKLRCKKVEGG